ncbi:MAG: response regulator [Pseudomonadota bacterium]
MNLAIVDDNADFRHLVRRVAEPMGWRVDEYADGALFKARLGDPIAPDLVFLDVLMQEEDGIEVIAGMAQHGFAAPVVIVSSADPTYANIMFELATAADVTIREMVRKPLPLEKLRHLLTLPA